MTPKFLTVLCAFVSLCLHSISQTTFQKIFGDTASGFGISCHETSDNGFIISSHLPSQGSYTIIRTDYRGDTIWTTGIVGPEISDVQQIIGGYIAYGTGRLVDYIFLAKIDSNGDTLWIRSYRAGNYISADRIIKTFDGGLLLTGFAYTPNGAYYFFTKTDSTGNILFTKFNSTYQFDVIDIKQTSDSGFIITGSDYYDDFYLSKLNKDADFEWFRSYSTIYDDWGNEVQQTIDEGYIVTGVIYNTNAQNQDICLFKTDSYGNLQWSKVYGDSSTMEVGYLISQTKDTGYVIGFNKINAKSGVIKTNLNGDLIWAKNYGDNGYCFLQTMEITHDDGLIFIGNTNSPFSGVYMIKTDSLGNSGCFETNINITEQNQILVVDSSVLLITTDTLYDHGYQMTLTKGCIVNHLCLADQIHEVNTNILFSLMPNPATNQFSILCFEHLVKSVSVFNILGEPVFMNYPVLDKQMIDISQLLPGIYFVQLQSKNGTSVQKLIKQ